MPGPRNALRYHFTHERNLERIVRASRLVSDRTARSEGRVAVDVGDRDVKSRRRIMEVTAGPRGCPADYVPFYFAPRSPMLYVISHGGVPEYQDGQDPLVYLVTDIRHVTAAQRPFVFSDGNCASRLTEYSDDLTRLGELIDWPLMRQRMWNDTPEDPDRKRRRMAEFLVHQHLPWDAVIQLGVRSIASAQRVSSLLQGSPTQRTPVLVREAWYYEADVMLTEVTGNLLDADVDALVNTVNTVGVMGKGVALQFKQAFPANFRAYREACGRGEVQLGRMFVVDTGQLARPRYIVNFPTKEHWRSRSRLGDIERGLADLVRVIQANGIRSIAVPALGCGNGGLSWPEVRPLLLDTLGPLTAVDVWIYPPQRPPTASSMRIETRRPRMTAGRAALIGLLQRYTGPGMGVTPIELQKLMYLLQSAGEPLSLNYAHGHYGPYAENLNHVLQAIEGHFVRGYGDRSRAAPDAEPLELVPGAVEEAGEVLAGRPDSRRRFDRVLRLIEGFESAYGLELLATVHWIVTHEDQRAAEDVGAVVTQVQSWSGRKRRLFGERHITLAWSQLRLQGWFAGSGTA